MINNTFASRLSKSTLQKLTSTGTQPANFYTLIKDHKNKDEKGAFPLRPIASVHNTPTNKIDWVCGRILNQLVQFVPAHLPSSLALKQCLNNLPEPLMIEDAVFISFDVEKLYPSVPIAAALKFISEFAASHWHQIDNLQVSVDNFVKMLTFVSYNYEIQFKDKTYLQIKGCPMGSHYAPPLSIIFLHSIEDKALTSVESNFGIKRQDFLYKRYVDDTILGPFKKDLNFFEGLLSCFNAVDKNIQFTLEVPTSNRLHFLDLSIWLENKKVVYSKYRKSIASDNTLRKNSWLPSFVKSNFVKQSLIDVNLSSSSNLANSELESAFSECKRRLSKNGFNQKDISKALTDIKQSSPCTRNSTNFVSKKNSLETPFC